jgi:tetratricopeptide (TPR) repeat protein
MRSLAVAFATTLTATALHAAPFDYKAVAAQAETQVAANDFAGAERTVMDGLQHCDEAPNVDECKAYLRFTFGYVMASQGDNTSLVRAEKAYAAAAQFFSTNAELLTNLGDVQLRLGKNDDAAKAFENAASQDAAGAAARFLSAAESFRAAGDAEHAIAFYRKAVEKGSVKAASGLVSLMVNRIEETLAIGRDLRTRGFTDAAIQAFETVMAQHERAPEAAADAAVAWAEVRANTGTLSAGAFERLPAGWTLPFLDSVADAIRGKWTFSFVNTPPPFVRYAASAVGKSAADALLVAGERAKAYVLYDRAMIEGFLPREQEQIAELKGLPVVYLDAAVQMARISAADGDKAKFTKVEQRLFSDLRAYESQNWTAVQRMHTVLGTIYAERNQWTSDNPLTNATFQLTQAIDAAKHREEIEHVVQPLPYLHETLANGYRSQGNTDLAAKEELAAARDYLDVDALKAAGKVLSRTKSTTNDPVVVDTYNKLTAIDDYRSGLTKIDWKTKPPEQVFATQATPVLDADFLARQRFKTFADLSDIATKKGDSDAAKAFSDDATKALQTQRYRSGSSADWLRRETVYTVSPKAKSTKPVDEELKYQINRDERSFTGNTATVYPGAVATITKPGNAGSWQLTAEQQSSLRSALAGARGTIEIRAAKDLQAEKLAADIQSTFAGSGWTVTRAATTETTSGLTLIVPKNLAATTVVSAFENAGLTPVVKTGTASAGLKLVLVVGTKP